MSVRLWGSRRAVRCKGEAEQSSISLSPSAAAHSICIEMLDGSDARGNDAGSLQ